ncbi:MAG: helix-turn-helix transcriptional regulator [Jatrophihabitans sp.]
MSGAADRLPRLLAVVPYLLSRPGVPLAEAARDFDVSESQLRRDLELLWMCGLPGHGPGDLIDLAFSSDSVSVTFDAGMSRPLRLTAEEALALVVALRTLAETPDLADHDAVERALAKVETAAGGRITAADAVTVSLDDEARAQALAAKALEDGRALRMRYYTAARDETTERTVDPIRLFSTDGRQYLEAWCRNAEGLRVFRLDRIEWSEVLDEPASIPEQAAAGERREGVYEPAPEHLLVELELGPGYEWVSEYYHCESVSTGDGVRRASLRVSDPAWVRRLLLGSAGRVRVLDPPWLADAIRETARTALAAYPSSGK